MGSGVKVGVDSEVGEVSGDNVAVGIGNSLGEGVGDGVKAGSVLTSQKSLSPES